MRSGLRQREIADRVGCLTSTVCQYVSGELRAGRFHEAIERILFSDTQQTATSTPESAALARGEMALLLSNARERLAMAASEQALAAADVTRLEAVCHRYAVRGVS